MLLRNSQMQTSR